MRKNDILFFNLHRRYLNQQIKYGGFLGIYVLAAFLNRNGYNAQSYEGGLSEGKKILDEVCLNRKTSMIGLYCDYENVTENIFLSRYIKEEYQLPVIVGGPQATSLGIDFYTKSKCDAIIRYEGEITVLELMDFYIYKIGKMENILGISYLGEGRIIKTDDRPVIQNLDLLPFIDENCYLEPQKRYRELSIMTGRGCPFHCSFCHEGHHTRTVRLRSVENVLQEIKIFLIDWPETRLLHILFTDDTFTLYPHRVKNLCNGLKKLREKRNFRWFCEGHVRTLYRHPEMIKEIADSGAYRIQLGIEAGTQQILDAYRKNTTIEEIKTVVKLCCEAKLEVFGNIILGSAFYDSNIYEQNLAFAKELLSIGHGYVELGVLSLWPLPETDMTIHPEYYNLKIVDKDFLTSVGDFPQIETKTLDRWHIASHIKNMETELTKYMIYMIESREISTSRIMEWFPESEYAYNHSLWYQCLLDNDVLFAYYSFLHSGEGVSSDNVRGDIYDAHPMRVVPLYNNLRHIDENQIEFCRCVLKGIERDILLLTTGKLSVREILSHLDSKGIHISHRRAMDLLMRLEKHHLIVWSQY